MHVTLLLKRNSAQEASLQSFLKDVQTPASTSYKKFLTPEQFGERFGISDADLSTVRTWLERQGFVINKLNKGRTAIDFSGTVGQLEVAFHTTIHRYLIDGQEHLANSNDPQIPASLSNVIAGVASLNDLKPRSNVIRGPEGKWNPQLARFVPELTITSGAAEYLFTSPGDAATIYDAPNSLNTLLAANQTQYDGTGVTIGVIGDSWLNFDDVQNYRTLFGIPLDTLSDQLTIVYDGDEDDLDQTEDQTEALLDTEVSGALAPGANIILYTAGDTAFQPGIYPAIYRALDDNKVNILSLSYGECEASLGAAGNLQILNAWEQAAAQGITVVVSSGDSGSAGCDNPNTESVATMGLAVNGLAATPYDIAVGGTDFDILANHFSAYVSSTNTANYTSALGYIPENPWNNSPASNGMLAANSVYTNSAGVTNIVAGGGGQSAYPKPVWQQQFPPSDNDSVRDLPDVALLAANGRYGALWAICGDNQCPGSNGTISGVGGTSASAPAFAGILAMVNQKIGASTRMGQVAWIIYGLAQTQPSLFHQIVTGNNSVHCAAGSLNCGSNGFLSGYNSGSSYNLATGLGSVDISNLVNNWSDGTTTGTTTSLSLSQTSFTHGTPVQIDVTVTPTAATGDVAIENNYASQLQATTSVSPTRVTLSGGSASETYSQFPGGTYNVYASYPGTTGYSGSVSQPVGITVSPENSVLQLAVDTIQSNGQLVSVAGTTIPLGTPLQFSAQPIGVSQVGSTSPITDATGTVYIDDNGLGLSGPLDATGRFAAATSYMNAGSQSVSATYYGDLSYNPSTSSTISYTVAQAQTSISVSSNLSTITNGEQLILTGQMTANAPIGAISPTGTITFTDTTNNTILGATPPLIQCTGTTAICFYDAINLNSTQLSDGANNIVATYSGDNNYVGSGPSVPISVNCAAGCSNTAGQYLELSFGQMTPSTGISAPGGSLSFVVSVSPGGGFTGAVNMSCSVTGRSSSDVDIPTCSFAPIQVNIASSNAVSSTLTINTTAPTTGAVDPQQKSPWTVAGGSAFALLLLLFRPVRQTRQRLLFGILSLCLIFGCLTACGGGGSSGATGSSGGGSGTTGTTPDTYTVTFTAADAATGKVTAQDFSNFNVP